MQNRHPTPLTTNIFSHINYSNTEDPEDTASEASITIHSQDKDSTDYNAISPPRTYYIPVTPPKTMLPRPSHHFQDHHAFQYQNHAKPPRLNTTRANQLPKRSDHHTYQSSTIKSKNQPRKSLNQMFSKQLVAFQDQQRKPLENNQLMITQSQYQLEKHHFY